MPVRYECDSCGQPADVKIDVDVSHPETGGPINDYTILLCNLHYTGFTDTVLAAVNAKPNHPDDDDEEDTE